MDLTPVNFVVYNEVTRAIVRSGTCPRRDVASQAREGEAALETSEYKPDFAWKVSPTGDVIPIND